MKVYLSNLGSIKYGEIELGDITLFVGKPNTGKSLTMKAILRESETNGVVYLPYSRPFSTLQNLVSKDLVKYDEKIFSLVKPLLRGQLKCVNDRLVYVEEDKVIPWEHVSTSVLEIVSFLLSVKVGSLILYEEPEAHLHEELQLLMGMVLYALSSINRIVISTHSQTIVFTITHLSMLKPTKEELKDLFEDLKVKDYEALAEAVEKANEKVKVKVYHFTEGGIKEVSVKEAMKGMPGTQDVLEKEFRWFSLLYLKRLFGYG